MIVKMIDEIIGSEHDIMAGNGNWLSRRILLKNDGMGFSFHETIIFPDTETHIWYKNHLEAVYCIEGEGEIETVGDGKKYGIMPGMLYALDKNDEHWLRCSKKMKLICVFVPPLTGAEVHDGDGSYSILEG
ncbi:MAG: L-ectoine synthase [Spirochaetae bacterium HGW-Spirochaetae-1]|nr:MAG: L-ectoine synthase [Spirochaetae bacterium HGW-Spirochaetae-1]